MSFSHHRIVSIVFLLLSFYLPMSPAAALETNGDATAESAAASNNQPIPETLITPRATVSSFLRAMNDIKRGQPERIDGAIATLDIAEVSSLIRSEVGRDLAWTLLEVMDRTRRIDLHKVPDYDQGRPYVFESYPEGSVTVGFVPGEGWLFSRETLRVLPAILDGLQASGELVEGVSDSTAHLPLHLRIRAQLPDSLKTRALVLENWQWLGLLLTVIAGVIADKLASIFLARGVRNWRERLASPAYRHVPDNMLRPLGLMLMAGVWWGGLNILGLPANALLLLLVSVKFLVGLSGVWVAYRLVDLFTAYLWSRAERTQSKLDDALVPLVSRVLKIFVSVLGIVFIADNLNINVTSLLAGLGLGGLAFALAAKDVVSNLFGSVTVLMDRTFNVGDWVKIGDIEGTVESIGFRSSRLRSFYNSKITVPNSTLITANVDNMGERRYRRLSTTLGLAYDTSPQRLESFCEGVRELVRLHPYMRKDYFHVYFSGFGASSLDIMVYVFWEVPDWSTELRERHRFLLDILRLAEQLGVEFAYPTQTLYMKRAADSPPPAAAEAFTPGYASEDVERLAQQKAREIVASTTGLDSKPPPVKF